jgi:putative spermidine/putrescine transport system permease protein
LSFSTLGTFIVFVYMWLPFMILPLVAAIERMPASARWRLRPTSVRTRHHLPPRDPAAGDAGRRGLDLHLLAHAGRLHHPQVIGDSHALHRPGRLPQQGVAGNIPFAAAFTIVPIVIIGRTSVRETPREPSMPSDLRSSRRRRTPADPWRGCASGAGMALGGMLFLHVPLALIVLYAFSAEDKSLRVPAAGPDHAMVRRRLPAPDVWEAMPLSAAGRGLVDRDRAGAGNAGRRRAGAGALLRARGVSLLLILPIALPGIITGIALRSGVPHLAGDPVQLLDHRDRPRHLLRRRGLQQRGGAFPPHEPQPDRGLAWISAPTASRPAPRDPAAARTALLAGGMLAFALSFDEVIVTTFTAGQQTTLPIWMLQELIRPRQRPVTNVVAVLSSR